MKAENIHGTGAVQAPPDSRDYLWEEIGFGSAPFDWSKGYDVEEELGIKLDVKNQDGSGSCGGQAWSYFGQVLDPEHEQKSAKFIYAHTHGNPAGSSSPDNSKLVKNKGWGSEALTPSYDAGMPPGEAFMQRLGDITPEAYTHALSDRAVSYAYVGNNADTIAQAVRDNKGMIFGVTGQNNGTWNSTYPKHPVGHENLWYHWLYCGKVKMIDGKKHFGVLNSWGTRIGTNGWQWISEDYLPWTWNNTILVYNANPPETFAHHFTQTLHYGSLGMEVVALQYALQVEGLFTLNVFPRFGNVTLGAVKAFQTKHGLVPDGIVGPLTNAVLNSIFDK